MSAIAGIFRFDGSQVEPGSLERITDAMASSGPDGAAHWFSGSVGLGHCMLRTTHEATHEVQPLENDARNVVLVMDGRLDNREELQRAFTSRAIVLRSDSDAELVLHAYQVWGDACPARLLGDFAFAIWDGKHQRLFCAVDHMGASQLCYVKTDRFCAFASTEEALLTLPEVSPEPNEELIAALLVPGLRLPDPAASWLRQVQWLMPGCLLSLTPNGISKITSYFQWEPGEEARFASEAEAQEEFLSVFKEAVRCRLRSSGSVAQMLSGGLDSASILAMIQRTGLTESSASIQTFSAISDFPGSCPETRCIQSLAGGQDAQFVAVPSFSGMVSLEDLADVAWSRAHPCDNSITLPALMCLAASRRGTRIMLHGASGDVTTGVPNRYIAYFMRDGNWKRAWDECQHASINNNYLRGVSPLSLFALNLWTAITPAAIKAMVYRARESRPALAGSAINPEFAKRLRIEERLRLQHEAEAAERGLAANIRDGQAQLLRSPSGPALGLSGYGRLGRRYGMEMRDPWGDKRVVEYFLHLPLAYKTGQGWTKYMVRRSLASQLDSRIVWRVGKEHLGWQLTRCLMQNSRNFIRQSFEMDFEWVTGYIDADCIHARLNRYLNSVDVDTPQAHADRESVYQVLTVMLWLKRLHQIS